MSISRRRFLAAASALTCAGGLPAFWRNVAYAVPGADQPGASDSILVVIELTGGNDGLNTVIPFSDPLYVKARPQLQQPRNKVLKIDDQLALHPALTGLSKLLERSQLAIIQGVGYPNPNRSHFVSMDIWQTASFTPDEPYGWLGRGVEKLGTGVHGLAVAGSGMRALNGPAGRGTNLRSLADYDLKVSTGPNKASRRRIVEEFAAGDGSGAATLEEQMKQAARQTYQSVAQLRQAAARYNTPVNYPNTGLADRLKLVARFITAGVPERVYYVSLSGFDTHSNQESGHAALLGELAGAIAAFHEDLTHHGQARRVLTVTFSEFGRRVKENGSQGTDHGAASQMFVVGEPVVAGPIGAHPRLDDLDDGDLKFHTDFRSVYATLLDDWLKVPSIDVLGSRFAPVAFLKERA